MHTTRRGEPVPINQALNRPRAKLGLDLSTWMAIVFVCVTVFLVGFRMPAMLAFPMWLAEDHHARLSSVFAPHIGHPHSEDLDPRIPEHLRGHTDRVQPIFTRSRKLCNRALKLT
jgi:hypothetical protein